LHSEIVLRMDGVWKRFRRGELFDSLRDAIPALAAKLIGRRRDVSTRSREFWALSDISLALGRGEALGIIGHNGAGKSTILKLLSGVLKPNKGAITVNGSLSALIEVGAGFHPDLTGRENIYLNGAILGLLRAEVTRKFDQIVEFSGLAEFLDTPVKRYSTGMYARLGFSVAAHVNSDILIVDEVLSVGDFLFQQRCMERMKEVVAHGTAVVFVSHNLDAVANFCTRAILLDHGRVAREGNAPDVITAYMEAGRTAPIDGQAKHAFVSGVVIRDQNGPRATFHAGDDAWLDVDVTANKRCERLSFALYLRNQRGFEVFHTSTIRLGLPPLTIEPGETRTITVHLKLHLAGGPFHVGVRLYKYDFTMNKGGDGAPLLTEEYDERYPLSTFVVSSPIYVGEVANLYPDIAFGSAANFRSIPERRFDDPASDAVNGFDAHNRLERLARVIPDPACRQ
jgi:lipopolysaccharide transport system ATP-binding protein